MKERKFAGTLGAFLFALTGAFVYLMLMNSYVCVISGLAGVIAALYGYCLFGWKQSRYGIAIAITAAVIMLTAAWYVGAAVSNLEYYREAENPGFPNTFLFWLRYSWVFMLDREGFFYYLKDLLILYVFTALECFGVAKTALSGLKRNQGE